MEKQEFERAKREMDCIPGGVLEACLIIREYIHNIKKQDDFISSDSNSVTAKEFIEAVRVLLANTRQINAQDIVPDRFKCYQDCSRLDYPSPFCPGEFQLASKDNSPQLSMRICPYYSESDK